MYIYDSDIKSIHLRLAVREKGEKITHFQILTLQGGKDTGVVQAHEISIRAGTRGVITSSNLGGTKKKKKRGKKRKEKSNLNQNPSPALLLRNFVSLKCQTQV